MSKVYIIKHETDFGPFFSSKEKVIAYLKDPDHADVDDPSRINPILEGRDPYINVLEVELDDEDVCFDG